MASAGNLQVSVVEGRNLKPILPKQTVSPYVVLTFGSDPAIARTDAVEATTSPKWVKDFKLKVPDDKPDLQVSVADELTGPLGSVSISIAEIEKAGTTVHWYKLRNAAKEESGEVCLVLRFIPAKKGEVPTTTNSSVNSSVPSTGAKTNTGHIVKDQVQKIDGANKPAPPPAKAEPINATPKVNKKKETALNREESKGLLAIAGGIAAIAAAIFAVKGRKRPRYYEVKEGDTLCSIAGCYGDTADHLYELNKDVTDDPDRIYPGDRIFIP